MAPPGIRMGRPSASPTPGPLQMEEDLPSCPSGSAAGALAPPPHEEDPPKAARGLAPSADEGGNLRASPISSPTIMTEGGALGATREDKTPLESNFKLGKVLTCRTITLAAEVRVPYQTLLLGIVRLYEALGTPSLPRDRCMASGFAHDVCVCVCVCLSLSVHSSPVRLCDMYGYVLR